MSPLVGFLIFIISLTAIIIAYLTKQFQEENLFYANRTKIQNINSKIKFEENEKILAETLNGRFAMIGLVAAVGAYLTTGQIIPGFV